MVQIFCEKRGSGKTKRLIELANHQQINSKGVAVYIDDDSRPMFQLNRQIRFVNTKDYGIKECSSLYGMICGILSSNYDIENIYIDGLLNIVEGTVDDSINLFKMIESIGETYDVNVYINVNLEGMEQIPECIKEYVA